MFTASTVEYAKPIINKLDPKGELIDYCLYRDACSVFQNEYFVKDLNRLGRFLEDIIIVDNHPASYLFHPRNAIPVTTWHSDRRDVELKKLVPILKKLS